VVLGFGLRRFMAYALLILGAYLAAANLGGRAVLPEWVLGAGVLIGIAGLTRFLLWLKANPIVEESDVEI